MNDNLFGAAVSFWKLKVVWKEEEKKNVLIKDQEQSGKLIGLGVNDDGDGPYSTAIIVVEDGTILNHPVDCVQILFPQEVFYNI